MKKPLSILLSYLYVLIAFYLTASFIAWELNPANWSEGARSGLAVITLFLGTILAIFTVNGD